MHRDEKDKIYSKRVRAGKRTYFFDVRSTRANDFYLTITESRRFQKEGDFVFEKSKMFIYKEDFHKFVTALQDTLQYIKEDLMPEYDFEQPEQSTTPNHLSNQNSDDTFLDDSSFKWE